MPSTKQVLIGEISSSLEDYLEVIYFLSFAGKTARVRDIARSRNVAMSSVTNALKKLALRGLVRYEAREFVTLTSSGRSLARRLSERHRFLSLFLHDILGVEAETAARDACMMEHVLSSETMERLLSFSREVYAGRGADNTIKKPRRN